MCFQHSHLGLNPVPKASSVVDTNLDKNLFLPVCPAYGCAYRFWVNSPQTMVSRWASNTNAVTSKPEVLVSKHQSGANMHAFMT